MIPNLVTNNAVLYIDRNFRASQVNIFNSTGGLVKQLKVTPGTRQLDISTAGFASGAYTIVTIGEGKATMKMVVQH